MDKISEIFKTLGGLPATALVAVVIVSAFGLAAYAIYAVTKLSKRS
jgi:hypothetical protein